MTDTIPFHADADPTAESPAPEDAIRVARESGEACGLEVYPRSVTAARSSLFFLGRRGGRKLLGVLSSDAGVRAVFDGAETAVRVNDAPPALKVCETTRANAEALRAALPHLAPRVLGLRKSVGCGDRLGLATPGHVRAVRGSAMAPVFAQQSVRENARTGRAPREVLDDALWGVFQEGWRGGYGADADHLKTAEDFDLYAAAGYTFFTVDPSAHVDGGADADDADTLRRKAEALPWDALETTHDDTRRRFVEKPIDLGPFELRMSEEELARSLAKYGRAVAHTSEMYRRLASLSGARPFEVEMSVDETETPTTLAEHVYIAAELRRLGVRVVSLAPRFVGRFEKGVDYVGDLSEFERAFAGHVAVARAFGPYKLSLHSGSDKFSIYPIAARLAGDLVHLKTAGTSYLEALRAVASINPALFREVVRFARERYPADRATYHVSAEVGLMPDPAAVADAELPALLEEFHAREVLHVTFGSVLNREELRAPFLAALCGDEETYYRLLEAHFARHLAPFGEAGATTTAV
jgi:tagaturonate epimerase